MRSLLVGLALLALAFSGCTDDTPDEPALTEADCAALGMVLGEQEVMADNGSMVDGEHRTEPACVPAGPPATVTLEGLPATATAYEVLAFQWVLHTDGGEMHTMDTQVRYSETAAADADLGQPSTWGKELAKKEHQNFVDGQAYDASVSFEAPGTIHFRAYALVNGENLWSDDVAVTITEPAPTGQTTTVTVSGGGLPQVSSLDKPAITISLGDGVQWATTDPAGSWSIASDSGPESFNATTGGAAVVFLVPGNYAYTATGSFTGTVSGTIKVEAPSA